VTFWSLLHAVYGPFTCIVVLYLLWTLVRDPTGRKREEKKQAYRANYRLTKEPTKEVLSRWAKIDAKEAKRLARLKTLDKTKRLYVSIPAIRAKLQYHSDNEAGQTLYATGSEGERGVTDKDNFQEVKSRGLVVGGQVTLVFLLIGALLLVLLLELFLVTPTPTLPEALSTTLDSYDINERLVETVPYAALDTVVGGVLADWTVAHDNLYVVEVVGGDWGTSCIDYSVIEGMSQAERLKVVYGASAGLLPVNAQPIPPTPLSAIRDSGSLKFNSEGCTLKGSGMPCESLYTKDWFNPVEDPLVAYACYVDRESVYHHLTLVSTAMSSALPIGEDTLYSVTWVPSAAYPLMGKANPAGVKVYTLPPSTAYMYEDAWQGPVVDWLDEDMPASYSPLAPRFFAREYITCGLYLTLKQHLGEEVFTQDELDGVFSLCVKAPDRIQWSLFGTDTRGANAWDPDRATSATASALPIVQRTADSYEYQTTIPAGCILKCIEGECIYTGLLCEAMQRGSDLYPSSLPVDATLSEIVSNSEFLQPEGVICPSQEFFVSTQRGTISTPFAAVSFFGLIPFLDHFGVLYNDVSNDPSVCDGSSVPTEADPLSVTIHRTTVDSVTTVEFCIPSSTQGIVTAVALVGTVFASHAAAMMVIIMVYEKTHKHRESEDLTVSIVSPRVQTDMEPEDVGPTTALLRPRTDKM
ncbi:hypothetical protein KIPB_008150, partial [Kipferlia bialata]